eukprot:UN04042
MSSIRVIRTKSTEPLRCIQYYIIFVGFVVFNNISLNYNSVGFYQLMKTLTTPVIAFVQYFVYGTDLHYTLKFALLPIIIGVGMATVTDVQFNTLGLP